MSDARKPGDAVAADEEFGIIEFCTGKNDDGRPVYCYVSVRPSQYEAYLERVASGEVFDPADFGRIIKSGEGRAPARDIMKEMERVYNIRHNFEGMVEHDLQALADALHKKKKKSDKD